MYKRQGLTPDITIAIRMDRTNTAALDYYLLPQFEMRRKPCLLYTSDAADDLLCVDLGGRRILKKKTNQIDYMYSSNRLRQ